MPRAAVISASVTAVALAAVAVPSVVAPDGASGVGPRSSSVTASPTSERVRVQAPLAVTGRVRPALARPVDLQRRVGGVWSTVQTVRSARGTGRYAVDVPTTMFVGRTQYRVVVPATSTHRRAVSDPDAIKIVGKGSADSRALLFGGQEVYRWNPCATIDYRVNLEKAPAGTLKEIRRAVARISAQSGLRFEYAGSTTLVPRGSTSYPRGTELILAWARPGESPWLPKGPAGVGGAWGTSYRMGDTWVRALDRGFVLIESGLYEQLDPGFTAGQKYGWSGTRGQLLMHEIGHAVGMGHASSDRGQLMFPVMQEQPAIWGKGDAANLNRLGLGGGCLPAPSAAAARLAPPPTKVAYLS